MNLTNYLHLQIKQSHFQEMLNPENKKYIDENLPYF
jgi:hypothetical protein